MNQHEEIWIVMDLPNRALSPNFGYRTSRSLFMHRAAKRKQRRTTAEKIKDCNLDGLPWTKCEVEVLLYHRTKRGRDLDNATASLKAMYDGIVDAGVVADDTPDKMVRKWPQLLHDNNQPRMEVIIRRLE